MSTTVTETSPAIELTQLDSKGQSTYRLSPQTAERLPGNSSGSTHTVSIVEDALQQATEGTQKEFQRKELVQLSALCWGAFLSELNSPEVLTSGC